MLALALFGLASPASAFCGTYVGQAGAELYNGASQVVVARQGSRTTLTLVNDFQGNLSEFALLIPVPEVLGPEDVSVVAYEAIARADAWSAPRLVSYTCDDFNREDFADTGAPSADGGSGPDADGSVTVEAQFSVGEYEIVLLSSSESGALLEWLDGNGYAVDASAQALLQEYIDGGAVFFAARVALDELPPEQTWLSPLQLGYEAAAFSLPVRLGTLNSSGEQDLLLYVLSDAGQTHISNYPQVEVEDECMYVESDWQDFGVFYDERLGAATTGTERAGWILEYGWTPSSCDPCADEPLTDEELGALGWEGDTSDAYFSRIHMRYAPGQVDADLMLYGSGLHDTTQVRYILYDPQLEDRFPLCVSGWAEEPGTCGQGGDDEDDEPQDSDPSVEPEAEPKRSCGPPVASSLWLAALGLALVGRRRRARGAGPR